MLIASNPKLLLLDEPTTGMTEEGKHRTAELIRKIAEKPHCAPGRARHAHRPSNREEGHRACIRVSVLAEGPLAEVVENETGAGGLSRQREATLMLRVEGIDTFYGTSHILHGISLDVGDGELVRVLGRNGAGKTTLLRSITGVNPADERHDRARWRRHHPAQVASAHASRHQLCAAGPADHSRHHCRGEHRVALLGKGHEAPQGAGSRFRLLPALRDTHDRKGGVLSGRQQQQLAIARALVQEPKLLALR